LFKLITENEQSQKAKLPKMSIAKNNILSSIAGRVLQPGGQVLERDQLEEGKCLNFRAV
jgi:hypothetical protein